MRLGLSSRRLACDLVPDERLRERLGALERGEHVRARQHLHRLHDAAERGAVVAPECREASIISF